MVLPRRCSPRCTSLAKKEVMLMKMTMKMTMEMKMKMMTIDPLLFWLKVSLTAPFPPPVLLHARGTMVAEKALMLRCRYDNRLFLHAVWRSWAVRVAEAKGDKLINEFQYHVREHQRKAQHLLYSPNTLHTACV